MTTTSTHPTGERGSLHPAPITGGDRIGALDALRGFALLGILVMNVQAFSMPLSAYVNPTAWGNLTGADYLVWLLGHVLTDQKMMTIFSMLYGAGIVVFTDRVAARRRSPAPLHYRRSLWLLLFGVLHAYLLWFGDILFLYGVCALAVFWFRGWSPRWLLALGVAVVAVSSLIYLFFGWSMQFWPPEALTGFVEKTWRPTQEGLAQEMAAYQGGWMQQMAQRLPAAFEFQTFLLAIWGFWRAAGLMLVGMALYKLGVFSAQRSTRFYGWLIAAAVLVGIPLVGYGVYWNFAGQWGPRSLFFGSQFNYWGGLLVSLGWVGGVMLLCRHNVLGWLTRRLSAVGRTALSNYLLQTLLCTTVFYGHGLGLFGQVERVGQIAIVFGVWLLQLIVSPIWLRHFRYGPLEWLWRSLTYGRRQPFLRT